MKKISVCSVSNLEIPENANILSLSPFPPDGEWGGAIRSREINNAIKSVYPNLQVLHCHNLPVSINKLPKFMNNKHGQLDDILMLFKNFHTEQYIDNVPDVVIFDHPWLWEEAKKLKKIFPHIKIIHSSHNIEHLLKYKLLEGLKDIDRKLAVFFVETVEKEIAKEADLIICVTQNDKEWFELNGAKEIVIANNGTNSSPQTPQSQKPYALIVGSAHPPNLEGCIKYISDAGDWLIPNTSIVIVGSLSNSLKGLLGKEMNRSRGTDIFFVGVKNNDDLDKLVRSANVIVLPVPYGGGTNLKTAEALVSGRPVVGTTKSFFGFDSYKKSRNVVVTDDITDFRDAININLEGKKDTVLRYNYESLTWKSTLNELRNYLKGE